MSAWIHMVGSLQIGRELRLLTVTESYSVARWGVQLAKKLYSVESEIYVRERKRLGKNRSFSIVFFGENLRRLLIDCNIINDQNEILFLKDSVNDEIIAEDHCKRSFLKGIFIGGGSVSDPNKSYHLEFVIRNTAVEKTLCDLLAHYDLNAKSVIRKGSRVVYLKESDKITDLLTLIGAHGAILDFQNIRVYKDFRNNLNRKVNCETANLDKTANAAAKQLENIILLDKNGILRGLSAELQEAALLRVDNPYMTLAELGEMMSPPIGKSGMNHRLRKINALAEELRGEKGDKSHGSQGS